VCRFSDQGKRTKKKKSAPSLRGKERERERERERFLSHFPVFTFSFRPFFSNKKTMQKKIVSLVGFEA
jgi:hypothetical protein